MDRNFLIAVVLSMLVVMLYSSTVERPVPVEPGNESSSSAETAPKEPAAVGNTDASTVGSTSPVAPAVPAASVPVTPALREIPAWKQSYSGENFRAELTNRGGALSSYQLLDYEEWGPKGKIPVDLISAEGEDNRVGLTPFEKLGLGDLRNVNFAVEEHDAWGATFFYERNGISVRKIWRFDPAGNTFSLSVQLQNQSGQNLRPDFSVEWQSTAREGNEYTNLGLVARHDAEVERLPIASVGGSGFLGFGGDSGEPFREGDVEWFGAETQYFVGVLAPARTSGVAAAFSSVEAGTQAAALLRFDKGLDVPSGQGITQDFRGFVGPKTDAKLEAFGAGLDDSINRGWSFVQPLVRFFTWLLRGIYSLIPNYGIAIVLLTLMVRVATLPVVNNQMKQSEKMRELQPRMKEIQEKYADDKERQQQEMMSFYKETGFNPLSGCLPMLLQMPVFIGLFFALQSSIELRHAPFMLWMNDLSAPDMLFMIPGLEIPFRVLPVLMAASMVLQAKLTPMSPDPAQAQMMTTVMPLMMLVLFYSFPSGLVLYYMLSNFLGIAHQRWIASKKKATA